MMLLLSIVTVLLALGVVWTFVEWVVHISMVTESCDTYGWTGFKKFRKHFDKTEWVYDGFIEDGLFGIEGRYQKDKYFASIIRFDGIGMIINNPISFLLVKLYVQGYIQKNHKDEKNKRLEEEKSEKEKKPKKVKKKNYKW